LFSRRIRIAQAVLPALWLITTVMLAASPAAAQVVYRNDFEGAVGREWSTSATSTTPTGARRFLGEFENATVSLSLNDLPKHNEVTLSFDLFVIGDWDGNTPTPPFGPDMWSVGVPDENPLIRTTFSNLEARQAYPDPIPGGDNPPRTGVLESNSLGYSGAGDSVYRISVTFRHSRGNLNLNFAAVGLEGLGSERWGLDNVSVEVSDVRAGRISVSPKRLRFGRARAGAPKTRNVRIRNRTRGILRGNVGFLVAPFRVVSGSGSFTLGPRQSKIVVVEFAPTVGGRYSDALVITSDDPRRGRSTVRVAGAARQR